MAIAVVFFFPLRLTAKEKHICRNLTMRKYFSLHKMSHNSWSHITDRPRYCYILTDITLFRNLYSSSCQYINYLIVYNLIPYSMNILKSYFKEHVSHIMISKKKWLNYIWNIKVNYNLWSKGLLSTIAF